MSKKIKINDLSTDSKSLSFQSEENKKLTEELIVANKKIAFQEGEKDKRAAELKAANKEIAIQNCERDKCSEDLKAANKELANQNKEKDDRAAQLAIANQKLAVQNEEKVKRGAKLSLANYERGIIEASLDPLVTISPEGKITDMNEATVTITGVDREHLINSSFLDYFTEPDKASAGYQEVFAKGSVADYPLTLRRNDGKLTDVLFNGSIYKDDKGNVLGIVIVARDVTEQNRIASELMEAKIFAELATEIAEEAKNKAERATIIAETAVKAKQQFLSNMSHEIRTPMNAIIGFTKVVMKTDLSSKQKEYLAAIKVSGDVLILLINDILDLAKVDAGKMSFEETPFKMESSIASMLHLFETKIQEKNLQLVKKYDSKIPDLLIGDPMRLHQIILNLISNAVKFTTEGKITVAVNLLKETDDKATIEFSVTDTGIGIAENKINHIFDDFQQSTSGTTRLYGGTGLGLAIVKQLVELQGGNVQVKSEIDKGSSFIFVLSFLKAKEDIQLETGIVELNPDSKKLKVLVVEDIALNQLLMKTILDDFNFECEIAANGKIAVEKLQNDSYDVVLMDLQMPEMNGFEATKYIRDVLKSKIPIIALTADVTTVDLAKCKSVGMDDYIAKPVDERLLYTKITNYVKKQFPEKTVVPQINGIDTIKKTKYTDLNYLLGRTKSNPELMMEMITLYLDQTQPLINAMKQSMEAKDWETLAAIAHKIIPSFSIVGINSDYADLAKKVQVYASTKQHTEEIPNLVSQLDLVCKQACVELKEEYNTFKNSIK